MAGLDKNVVFLLTGESFTDSSYNNVAITSTKLTDSNIVTEEIQGNKIKCIDFNTTGGYLSFNLDDSFFGNAWTIDWWEKDSGTYAGLSGLFTNMIASGGNYFGIGKYQTGTRTFVNMAQSGSYFVNTRAVGNDITNEWVHRAIVYDGVSKYYLYQNGTLFSSVSDTKKAINNVKTFAMGKWRTNTYAYHKKVFNFRVSSIARWNDGESFEPQIEPYSDIIEGGIELGSLEESATLYDLLEKIREIKEVSDIVRIKLTQALIKKGVEADSSEKLQVLVDKIIEALHPKEEELPYPECFKTEPGNPFGTDLHSKIRYRDKDGLDRVIYSKVSSSGYPCFNEKTNILYFATKATFVQGYVYQNGAWSAIGEAYYGYLPSGVELESVYSNSVDIPYHSNSAYYGKTWKAKNDI